MQKYSFQINSFNGVNANLLFETASSKEICIAIQSGASMKEHRAPAPIVVQVLRGEIEFGVRGELITLKELDAIALDREVVHSLKALQNSVIRLTLSKEDSINRVSRVID